MVCWGVIRGVPAPNFVAEALGWRDGVPNIADRNNQPSVRIATGLLEALGVPPDREGVPGATGGRLLEEGVQEELGAELPRLVPEREWTVDRHRLVTDFAQYQHLARLQALIDQDESRTLSTEIGREYIIKPDVTVALTVADELLLHAAVSCKWTIRSDRVQNIRHEAVILTRHRRGRQPHIVALTLEPLPSRLASIARGTGEIDGVYHLALSDLRTVVADVTPGGQLETLEELVAQRRLFDFTELASVLAV